MLESVLVVVVSYLLGSIPTAVWTGKLLKGLDIREHGSGNAGATNTFRLLGWKPGSFVLIIDFLKGFVSSYYVVQLVDILNLSMGWFEGGEHLIILKIAAGFAAIIGHMYPIYAGFRGGKGVITAAGMLFGVEPVSVALALTLFVIVLLLSRYVSVASIFAAISYPIWVIVLHFYWGMEASTFHLVVAFLIAFGIAYKHKANIKRLREGTENRISSFKPAKGHLNKTKE